MKQNQIAEAEKKKPLILVICGPSGVGKTEVEKMLCKCHELNCRVSVSATTRKIRGNEVDGVDYHFLSKDEFMKRVAANGFLEWAEVHGNYYGTPMQPVKDAIAEDAVIILSIDVAGHAKVRGYKDKQITGRLKSVFLMPPSMKELRRRLLHRGDVERDAADRRLERAKEEVAHVDEFDYCVKAKKTLHTLDQLIRIVRENTH